MVNSTEQTPFWGFTFPLNMMRMMLLLLGLQTILVSVGKRTKHGGKIRASEQDLEMGCFTSMQNSYMEHTSSRNVLL